AFEVQVQAPSAHHARLGGIDQGRRVLPGRALDVVVQTQGRVEHQGHLVRRLRLTLRGAHHVLTRVGADLRDRRPGGAVPELARAVLRPGRDQLRRVHGYPRVTERRSLKLAVVEI